MEGVRDLCGWGAPGLTIVDSSQTEALALPAFAHSTIGRNQDPHGKIEAFADIVNHRLGNKADIVFMKFCYVDVVNETDSTGLFNYYRRIMSELASAYPNTRIMHVTVPVTVMPSLLRRAIGTLRGKHNRAAYDNLARTDYNRLLRETYVGKEPVFDLAAFESTTTAGRALRHSLEGRELQTLVPGYSSDGRHLSEKGRRVVAAALLKSLASVAATQMDSAHG